MKTPILHSKLNIGLFMSELKKMRSAINDNLIALMEHYKQREVDCTMFDDCPIVFNGCGDECMTLDSIEIATTPSVKCIRFNCSGSYNNDYTTPHAMDIELLIEVYEWIIANEEELFNNNED